MDKEIIVYIRNGILDFPGGSEVNAMKHYSAIKRNVFDSVLIRWMNLEPIMQNEVSQKEKDKYHVLTLTYGI